MDQLGSKLYMNHYASAWAWAADTPFQWGKRDAAHFGGTRDPLVVAWPARIKERGGLRAQFTHATDVASTIYEAVGVRFPAAVDGVKQQPLDGISFAYTVDQPAAASRHIVQIFEQMGNRSIYANGWVAGARHSIPWIDGDQGKPFESDRWELYHVDNDFSEAHDLAARQPQKLRQLQALFDREAKRNNVAGNSAL